MDVAAAERPRRRPNRSAVARLEQQLRSDARMANRLWRLARQHHRGFGAGAGLQAAARMASASADTRLPALEARLAEREAALQASDAALRAALEEAAVLRAVVTEAETRVGLAEAAAADVATAAAALEEMAQALESEQPLLARLRESVPDATLAER